ncbi:hypothetical protein SAMN06297144_1866 [Sphingomonas guangdongensis]|uniref:Uncharacterized protein n=1 Tax=Sphingomonas guangdongensis TaxID=1141890 RepID=A0A285R325_9SPHN|nr:hypothetical protein [Sphingomonas guangdongensis]SOB86757.1 hypothetical protein SAMN06297144_1866 [Sphingomonas guangdongensis]
MFGRYCEIEALFRLTVMSGQSPTAATMTELRKMAELLGIAGLKSRLAKLSSTTTETKVSPFTIRPKA